MITIKLKGGLGNQMFQYAFAYGIANPPYGKKREFEIDCGDIGTEDTVRNFELGCFGIKPNITTTLHQEVIPEEQFNPQFFRLDNVCFNGHWQNTNWFAHCADDIRKIFKPTFLSLEYSILFQLLRSSRCPVSLQIRRGDFVANGAVTEWWYKKALKFLRKRVGECALFVVSDDIPWCKKLGLPNNTVYISDGNITYAEMMLLTSQCDHHIISNSTFGWWGAWLDAKEGITIYPRPNKHLLQLHASIPDTWVSL